MRPKMTRMDPGGGSRAGFCHPNGEEMIDKEILITDP